MWYAKELRPEVAIAARIAEFARRQRIGRGRIIFKATNIFPRP
jgi:hypothetical protein